MDKNKKNFFWLVFAGLFCIGFLTLLTISFYGYVMQKIGVEYAENSRTYDKHFVMIVGNTQSQFWKDAYASVKEEAAAQNAYVELKGTSQSSSYTMADYMDMSIAARVDGILLECTAQELLEEKINEANDSGIPVVTILNDAPLTERKSYVGINPYQLGQEYASQIWEILPLDKEFLRITVLLHDNAIDSNQSQIFNQINNLMVTSPETAGRVKVEEIRISSERAFESEEIVWNLFQNEQGAPDIIVCMDEVDTEAVYQAVIDYNRVGETQVIGYYKSAATLDAIRRGTMAMSLYIDTAQMGRDSVQAMMECIRDGRTNSFYSVDLQFVTSENVSDFIYMNH